MGTKLIWVSFQENFLFWQGEILKIEYYPPRIQLFSPKLIARLDNSNIVK